MAVAQHAARRKSCGASVTGGGAPGSVPRMIRIIALLAALATLAMADEPPAAGPQRPAQTQPAPKPEADAAVHNGARHTRTARNGAIPRRLHEGWLFDLASPHARRDRLPALALQA